MISDELVDQLMARVDEQGLALTGEGGLIPELIKAVLERGLQVELADHLGYEKGDPAGRGSPNSRNGMTGKTVVTEVGDVALEVPRDRMGSFQPRLVPKGQRQLGGLPDMIISLYADDDPRYSHIIWRPRSALSSHTRRSRTSLMPSWMRFWRADPTARCRLSGGVPRRASGESP